MRAGRRTAILFSALMVQAPAMVGGQGNVTGPDEAVDDLTGPLPAIPDLDGPSNETLGDELAVPGTDVLLENVTGAVEETGNLSGTTNVTILPDVDVDLRVGLPHLVDGPASNRSVLPNVPSEFEPNWGQADPTAEFVARTRNGAVLLGNTSMWFAHAVHESRAVPTFNATFDAATGGSPGHPNAGNVSIELVEMRFVTPTANAGPTGISPRTGYSNYYSGPDQLQWLQRVPHFEGVRYSDVHEGIDVLISAQENRTIAYTILAEPGSDPREVRFDFRGARTIQVDEHGDLMIGTENATMRHSRPVMYQVIAGERVPVVGGFELINGTTVGINVGTYDPSSLLVIDPTIEYVSYLGGGGTDIAYGVAIDDGAAVYVTGQTLSTNFPLSSNPAQSSKAGQYDAFVTKIANGAISYSTYLGGSGDDFGQDAEVDSALRAYITGYTISTNFPTTLSAYQDTRGGTYDAFVTKLTGDGFLDYSTYVGGSSDDRAFGAGIDDAGRVAIAGYTTSGNSFPLKNEYSSANLHRQAFVTVVDTGRSGSNSLTYSTLYGELGYETAYDAAFDPNGRVAIVGETDQVNLVTRGAGGTAAYQSSSGGLKDAFVAQFDPTLSGDASLRFATYYGGSSYDYGYGIDADANSDVYITGAVRSSDLDVSGAPPGGGSKQGGTDDAFVAKISNTGSALRWASYVGGSARDWGNNIVVDEWENVYVAGTTYSTDLPEAENAHAKYADAFVTMIKHDASEFVASWYVGGASNDDQGKDIDVEDDGWFALAGRTASTDLPTTNPIQGDQSGQDGFVVMATFNRRPTIPTNPDPPDGAVDVTPNGLILSWDVDNPPPGNHDGVMQSTVYLDEGIGLPTTPVATCNPTAGESCYIGSGQTDEGKWYSWRVESCDELSCTEGSAWTFKTYVNTPPAPCMQVTWDNVTAQLEADASCTSDGQDSDADLLFRWYWSNTAGFGTGITNGSEYACLDADFSVTLNVTDSGGLAREVVRDFVWADEDSDGLASACEAVQGTVDRPSAAKPTWRTDVYDFDATDTDGDTLDDLLESQWNNQRDLQFCNGPCLVPTHYPNPVRKDVYVEMDYMAPESVHLPTATVLGNITAVFSQAPIDAGRGIAIHLDAGAARGDYYNLRGGEEIPHDDELGFTTPMPCLANHDELYDMEGEYYDAGARGDIFHWMVWAHQIASCGGNIRGIGEPGGRAFAIGLATNAGHGNSYEEIGLFIHELGHNFGLDHGGPGDSDNWKPNHPSVMNYYYAYGMLRQNSLGGMYYGYSQVDFPDLDEQDLDETVGLGDDANASQWRTEWYCPASSWSTARTPADGPLDWNCNGDVTETSVSVNLNKGPDGSASCGCTILRAHEEWNQIQLDLELPHLGACRAGTFVCGFPFAASWLEHMPGLPQKDGGFK